MPWYYSTPQPHHRYEFHTAILLANKMIYQEAAYILYKENLIVLVSINDEFLSIDERRVLSGFIEQCGVPVLARERQARELQDHAMKLYIGHWVRKDTTFCYFDASEDLAQESIPRTELIIAGDDLSLLCQSYVKFRPFSRISYERCLQYSFIRLEVLDRRSATYEKRLLEPFRHLHSQASVHIEGAISAEYKSEIRSEMMKAPQTAEDLLRSMTIAQNQAEEHFYHGNLELACTTYQTLIENVELGFEWPPRSGKPFRCNALPGYPCYKAVCFAELNVRDRLSEICLALERPSQALEWVNSALLMLPRHRDCIDANGTRISEAKLIYRFAWASHQMDVRCRALDSIEIALKMDPDNDHYKRVQQDWLEEEAQQPHEHGGKYPEACEGSVSWKLAHGNEDG